MSNSPVEATWRCCRFEDEFPANETFNRLQEIARNAVPAAVDDICTAFQLGMHFR